LGRGGGGASLLNKEQEVRVNAIAIASNAGAIRRSADRNVDGCSVRMLITLSCWIELGELQAELPT